MTVTIIGYTLAGLLAAGIIFIGARFIVAPGASAAAVGRLRCATRSGTSRPWAPYLSDSRACADIPTGAVFVIILIVAGTTHLVGWVILAATIIPLADATMCSWERGGSKSIAWGVHGVHR